MEPIISYCVLRDAYCVKEFEKTKPICDGMKYHKVFYERSLWQYIVLWGTKKQSQYADLWPEIRNTKPEIRKELKGYDLKKQTQFPKGQNALKYLYERML